MDCEAEALAELKGEWEPDRDDKALLVGNYLHSYFESPYVHGWFKRKHPDIISSRGETKGQLKSSYRVADKMIDTLKSDETFNEFYQGEKEVIIKGEIAGVKWKGKLDCFADNHKYFADIKTTRDIYKKYWLADQHRYGSFIEAFNYPLQMAIYQELTRQQYGVESMPIIVAVSKQDPPDKELVSIPQELLNFWLERVKELQPHIQAVKMGEEEPSYCGHCEFCRAHKELTGITDLYDLIE